MLLQERPASERGTMDSTEWLYLDSHALAVLVELLQSRLKDKVLDGFGWHVRGDADLDEHTLEVSAKPCVLVVRQVLQLPIVYETQEVFHKFNQRPGSVPAEMVSRNYQNHG